MSPAADSNPFLALLADRLQATTDTAEIEHLRGHALAFQGALAGALWTHRRDLTPAIVIEATQTGPEAVAGVLENPSLDPEGLRVLWRWALSRQERAPLLPLLHRRLPLAWGSPEARALHTAADTWSGSGREAAAGLLAQMPGLPQSVLVSLAVAALRHGPRGLPAELLANPALSPTSSTRVLAAMDYAQRQDLLIELTDTRRATTLLPRVAPVVRRTLAAIPLSLQAVQMLYRYTPLAELPVMLGVLATHHAGHLASALGTVSRYDLTAEVWAAALALPSREVRAAALRARGVVAQRQQRLTDRRARLTVPDGASPEALGGPAPPGPARRLP